jgi:hypothetical protein
VFPKRHRRFWHKDHHDIVGCLCRDCHDELEERISASERSVPQKKKSDGFYPLVWVQFLRAVP